MSGGYILQVRNWRDASMVTYLQGRHGKDGPAHIAAKLGEHLLDVPLRVNLDRRRAIGLRDLNHCMVIVHWAERRCKTK